MRVYHRAIGHKVLAALVLLGIASCVAAELTPRTSVEGSGFVFRAIDADTFIVNVDNPRVYERLRGMAPDEQALGHFNDQYRSIRIRLAHVDTPESVHPDASKNTEAGREASRQVAEWVEKENTRFHCWDFGHWGRLICSMEVHGEDLGARLIREGLSPYVTNWGRHPFEDDRYRRAEREAAR